ncbi:OmpA family protein [Roseococcus thiosulfatophilus]|uniref:OmpA family protein n=1 Tax=Roseococcus thiosulfatophilus TaxID=35813 RepID=UPI001A8DEC22|nr:OmpA family protein [Roseococcus thiosulfatophilus]
MSFKKALLAATVLSLPVAAQAQTMPVTGLYVGAGVGANYNQDRVQRLAGESAVVRSDVGVAAVGAVGWGFGNGIRAEVEANFRWNAVNRLSGSGSRAPNAGGNIYQYGVMGNAYYDFYNLGLNLGGFNITPYVGAGAGYVWSDFNRVRASDATGGIVANSRDGRFAYQAIVGAAVGMDALLPGLSLTTEYRFMGTLEPSVTFVGTGDLAGQRSVFKAENYNHSVLVGLRYAFNTPAPAPVVAPAPAPAPAPARTFLVFFDWDRADLTDRARQIIAEAATNARTVSSTRIEVSGHADRTGAAAYNQRLSVRRAEAVAAELVRRGINRNEITIQGFGFDRPLVPTAQGVREPQNRRVEIVLR